MCLVLSLGLGEIVMDRGDRADWFAERVGLVLLDHRARRVHPADLARVAHAQPIRPGANLITNRSFAVPTALLILLTFTAYGMQILNPVFLQDLLGYTAWKAGLAMAPRGMGVMAAMFLLGAIARKGFDTRPLVALGYILIGVAQWQLRRLDLKMCDFEFRLAHGYPGNRDGPDFSDSGRRPR